MIDRIFSLALAAGLLALAVSAVIGFGQGFSELTPRLVALQRVIVTGKRAPDAVPQATAVTAVATAGEPRP